MHIKKEPMQIVHEVLAAYGLTDELVKAELIGTGLINHTWKVTAANDMYILQKVNEYVFKKPTDIVHNIKLLADYLQSNYPAYLFVAPVTALDGNTFINLKEEGHFRLFPFIEDSHTNEIVETTAQAYEAAVQFGRFTKLLTGFNCSQLHITIPSFHNLTLRHELFLMSVEKGNQQRIQESDLLIKQLMGYSFIAETYKHILNDASFQLRVTHHDTKISNVLFDNTDKGLCVIDLDTVMPGYFISDVGDMMRTYLSPANEEETDFSKIEVRDKFYKAIVKGYLAEMKNNLSEVEKKHFFFAGQFMIYMQAIRFLTDYFNDDVYYGAKYAEHNLNRALNQTVLLEKFTEKKDAFTSFTNIFLC